MAEMPEGPNPATMWYMEDAKDKALYAADRMEKNARRMAKGKAENFQLFWREFRPKLDDCINAFKPYRAKNEWRLVELIQKMVIAKEKKVPPVPINFHWFERAMQSVEQRMEGKVIELSERMKVEEEYTLEYAKVRGDNKKFEEERQKERAEERRRAAEEYRAKVEVIKSEVATNIAAKEAKQAMAADKAMSATSSEKAGSKAPEEQVASQAPEPPIIKKKAASTAGLPDDEPTKKAPKKKIVPESPKFTRLADESSSEEDSKTGKPVPEKKKGSSKSSQRKVMEVSIKKIVKSPSVAASEADEEEPSECGSDADAPKDPPTGPESVPIKTEPDTSTRGRGRKIRWDILNNPPAGSVALNAKCGRCVRIGATCYLTPTADGAPDTGKTQACHACRSRKLKCEFDVQPERVYFGLETSFAGYHGLLAPQIDVDSDLPAPAPLDVRTCPLPPNVGSVLAQALLGVKQMAEALADTNKRLDNLDTKLTAYEKKNNALRLENLAMTTRNSELAGLNAKLATENLKLVQSAAPGMKTSAYPTILPSCYPKQVQYTSASHTSRPPSEEALARQDTEGGPELSDVSDGERAGDERKTPYLEDVSDGEEERRTPDLPDVDDDIPKTNAQKAKVKKGRAGPPPVTRHRAAAAEQPTKRSKRPPTAELDADDGAAASPPAKRVKRSIPRSGAPN